MSIKYQNSVALLLLIVILLGCQNSQKQVSQNELDLLYASEWGASKIPVFDPTTEGSTYLKCKKLNDDDELYEEINTYYSYINVKYYMLFKCNDSEGSFIDISPKFLKSHVSYFNGEVVPKFNPLKRNSYRATLTDNGNIASIEKSIQ